MPSPNHSVHERPTFWMGTTGCSTHGSTGTFSAFFLGWGLAACARS